MGTGFASVPPAWLTASQSRGKNRVERGKLKGKKNKNKDAWWIKNFFSKQFKPEETFSIGMWQMHLAQSTTDVLWKASPLTSPSRADLLGALTSNRNIPLDWQVPHQAVGWPYQGHPTCPICHLHHGISSAGFIQDGRMYSRLQEQCWQGAGGENAITTSTPRN